jgi:hypothetical protein
MWRGAVQMGCAALKGILLSLIYMGADGMVPLSLRPN